MHVPWDITMKIYSESLNRRFPDLNSMQHHYTQVTPGRQKNDAIA